MGTGSLLTEDFDLICGWEMGLQTLEEKCELTISTSGHQPNCRRENATGCDLL